MGKNFLFYDIETSGLNPCFDQILQFAYILTDDKLNEIERAEILVKPNYDLVPSPEAMLTHGFSINHFIENGLEEFNAVKKIHKLVNAENTISIGYNSLGFDDVFLRFSFYRNLLPVYTHQYANGCGRADLYPITVAYYLLKNDILSWPKRDNVPTMKLEYISEANSLAEGAAHDAMVDTLACVNLARKFIKEQKSWDYLINLFVKKIDIEKISELPFSLTDQDVGYQIALMVNGRVGVGDNYYGLVLGLGQHRHYKNQSLWLRLDSEEFLQFLQSENKDFAKESLKFVFRKKYGETPLLLPLHDKYKDKLDPKRIELANNVVQFLQNNLDKLRAIAEYHLDYKYPEVEHVDLDAALYLSGFMSDREQRDARDFVSASLPSKIEMVEEFRNAKLTSHALRILGRNFFSELPDHLQDEFLREIKETQNAVDYRGKARFAKESSLKRIEELRDGGEVPAEKIVLLDDLEKYLKS